jgi:hypothetical protein
MQVEQRGEQRRQQQEVQRGEEREEHDLGRACLVTLADLVSW